MHERWTDEELELLKKQYPKKSLKELMALLPNRCDSGITNKARRLGLHKKK